MFRRVHMTATEITPLLRCEDDRRSSLIRIGHTVVIHVRRPGAPSIPPEGEAGKEGGEHTRDKHGELRGWLMHTAREGQLGDQERDREADPGEEAHREKIADADAVGQSERSHLRDQRGDAQDTGELAHHERDDDRDGDRIRERAERAGITGEEMPAAKKAKPAARCLPRAAARCSRPDACATWTRRGSDARVRRSRAARRRSWRAHPTHA